LGLLLPLKRNLHVEVRNRGTKRDVEKSPKQNFGRELNYEGPIH
jgi:hypothetical protein